MNEIEANNSRVNSNTSLSASNRSNKIFLLSNAEVLQIFLKNNSQNFREIYFYFLFAVL